MLTFAFTPTEEQKVILKDYHKASLDLERVYEKLNTLRSRSLQQ